MLNGVNMAKEELLEFSGTVLERLPNAMFKVKLEMDMKYWHTQPVKCVNSEFEFWKVIKLM